MERLGKGRIEEGLESKGCKEGATEKEGDKKVLDRSGWMDEGWKEGS